MENVPLPVSALLGPASGLALAAGAQWAAPVPEHRARSGPRRIKTLRGACRDARNALLTHTNARHMLG